MAAPPKTVGLKKEDFPEAPEWFGKLAETLNPFLADTAGALGGRLTLTSNLACSVNTFTFTMPATRTDTPAYFFARNASGTINHAVQNQWFIPATEVRDTHSAYDTTTGIFTCPHDGDYEFSGGVTMDTATYSDVELQLFVNGVNLQNGIMQNTAGFNQVILPPTLVPLVAGNTVRCQVYQSNAALANRLIWPDGRINYFAGKEVSTPSYVTPDCFPLTFKAQIKGTAFKPTAVLLAQLRDTSGAVHNAGTPTWDWDGQGNVRILNIPGLTYGSTYEATFLTF